MRVSLRVKKTTRCELRRMALRPSLSAVMCALLVAACGGRGEPHHPVGDPSRTPAQPTASCAPRDTAAEPLPGVKPAHLTLDYWLARWTPEQLDTELMSPREVARHNEALHTEPDGAPLGQVDVLAPLDEAKVTTQVHERLAFMRNQLDQKAYVQADGEPFSEAETARLEAPEAIDFQPAYVVALEGIQVYCAPSLEAYFTPGLDLRFDRNRCSHIRPQEPLQRLARYNDELLLVRTGYTLGFMPVGAKVSAPLSGDDAKAFFDGPKTPLPPLASSPREARLSIMAPVLEAEGEPTRLTATAEGVQRDALGEGATTTARPLTRRAVLSEAFALLGTPYGWGGTNAGRDCSRFLMDIFSRFDLQLPRFSARQKLAGSYALPVGDTTDEQKLQLMDRAAAQGIVLLHFPGHIMLYLGRDEEGTPMAIHAFAEYLSPCEGGGETLHEVDKVTVSDLTLGRGSSRRAFIERIDRIVVLGPPPKDALEGAAELRPAVAPTTIPRRCKDTPTEAIFRSPRVPNRQQPLRVILANDAFRGPVALTLFPPRGNAFTPELRTLGGPPYGYWAEVERPTPGRWTAVFGDGDHVVACERFAVERRAEPQSTTPAFHEARDDVGEAVGSKPDATIPGAAGFGTAGAHAAEADTTEPPAAPPVWEAPWRWEKDTENLYALWVEQLFDYPPDEDVSWRSLHELLRNRDKNLLHNHLGQDEERVIELVPDCADLPYSLRAYFAFKTGLPYAYRRCRRGSAGEPPQCDELNTAHEPRPRDNSGAALGDLDAFAAYMRDVRQGVHSASARTLPTDDRTDVYPIALRREYLKPGTVFADPYGHLLVIAKWVPQTASRYGIMLGADAQPDGTIGRRRFWRGSFLFTPSTDDVGAGFKANRPLVENEETGAIEALGNRDLVDTREHIPWSDEQYRISKDDFYARMEALINPLPLDPEVLLEARVDALFESVKRRVISVDNGIQFMKSRDWNTVEMPERLAIFQTDGPWEDYATPSRDMRLLISIDTVLAFPASVKHAPSRYGVPQEDAEVTAAALEQKLAILLSARTFTYENSEGDPVTLSLAELVARRRALEMAYNPNDCVEIRWGETESSRLAHCQRHAPEGQRNQMTSYRDWFTQRERPAR